LTHSERAINVGIVASIVMPTEALWRRAAFEMQSPLAAALHISPFANEAIPSAGMVSYAALYMAVALLLADWAGLYQGTTSELAEKPVTLSERPVFPRVEGPLWHP
jgi:hypothetical protein